MAITGRFSVVSEVLVRRLRIKAVRGLVRVGVQRSHLRKVKLERDPGERTVPTYFERGWCFDWT